MNKDSLNNAFDYPVWSAVRFLESGLIRICTGTRKVRRTWRDRLFTRPWRPWQADRVEPVYEPDPNIYEIGHGLFTGHPVTIAKVRKLLSLEPPQ